MKKRLMKIASYIIIPTFAISFTACFDKYIYPMPKCTDEKVIKKLDFLLDKNSFYGSDAKIDERSIILVGINEKTNMKTCKTKVDYSIENDKNSTIINIINNMPLVSEISKNKDVTYTITQTKDKKNFIVEIID